MLCRYFSADVELADELMAAFVRPSAICTTECTSTAYIPAAMLCRYFSADVELADELMAAFVRPSAISVPERSDTIASYEANYWGNMTAGTGVEYECRPLQMLPLCS